MLLHDILDYQAREYSDGDFAIQGSRRISYAEARDQANRLANAVVASGLKPGERAAILSKNSLEYPTVYFATSKAGVALVPLNFRLSPGELAYIIKDSGARLLFASGEYVETLDGIRGEIPSVERYIQVDGRENDGWQSLAAFVEGQPDTNPDLPIKPEDDVYQMYTSGTTGRPKGAVLTHASVTANIVQLNMAMTPYLKPVRGQRYLVVAPVYHAAAAMTTFCCVYAGGTQYIESDFHPAEIVRALSEEKITLAMLVPAMIQACLVMVPDVGQRTYDDLRLIVYGASPISEQTLRQAIAVFGSDFAQGYGMTETTSTLAYLLPSDHERALREQPGLLLAAGRPLLGTEVRIVDEEDNPLPNGELGEIVSRGPQNMTGYWNQPEASAEALRGGWMHTGDAGRIDDEGYIYIQDRVKDMIVSGGENVYPREVEDVLFQHAGVADAAVIGVPDPQWGEAVKAIIVLREGKTASAEEIIEHCRGQLAGYKRPRSVDFVTELPRNPSGKVLKRELREPYWAGHDRRVAG